MEYFIGKYSWCLKLGNFYTSWIRGPGGWSFSIGPKWKALQIGWTYPIKVKIRFPSL